MAQVYDDNALSIGNTPLVKINRLNKGGATILAKVEGRNPAFSVKCRVGANIIWDAEKSGKLKPGGKIVEATSGNTGIALAFAAAAKGYDLTITMPDSMSIERRKVLTILGANVVLTPAAQGMKGAIDKANEIAAGGDYLVAGQFDNPANPEIHAKTTGPEILDATDGNVDILVSGVGTGGTITGVSRFLKQEKGLKIESVAVEPAESPVITQVLAGEDMTPGPHKIQGIGAGFIPKNLDLDIVDTVAQVTSDESIETSRALAREEGILCGISSGAAMAAALKLSEKPENAGKTIVAILPDAGERYLSSVLFQGVFNEDGTAK